MSLFTQDAPALALFTGRESLPLDNNPAVAGALPSFSGTALYKLALVLTSLMNAKDKTMVSGTIYYSTFVIGETESFRPDSGLSLTTLNDISFAITGVNVLVGSTGGTDTWHVGVYNSAGVLVARSITAGVTAGTASTIQQIALYQTDGSTIGPVTLASGTYYLALQSNGTTAKMGSINSPIWPVVTGSQTGVAGTLAAISAIATTYTANLGPMASLY